MSEELTDGDLNGISGGTEERQGLMELRDSLTRTMNEMRDICDPGYLNVQKEISEINRRLGH